VKDWVDEAVTSWDQVTGWMEDLDGVPEARVCMNHFRVNVCRERNTRPCRWSTKPEDVALVNRYQQFVGEEESR
jgi:hypothetical protein